MNHAYASPENQENDFHILDIFNEMRHSGIERTFIFALMENCQKYEGIRDLMEMWFDEATLRERDKIIADLQDCLDDLNNPSYQSEKQQSDFQARDLNEIRKDIVQFKQYLREEVDRQGGISKLARRTGIPQPSLSRFFSSSCMPRRTTLYKIAKALNLPESIVGFKWSI
jgi:DNA-binding phage protein